MRCENISDKFITDWIAVNYKGMSSFDFFSAINMFKSRGRYKYLGGNIVKFELPEDATYFKLRVCK